MQIDYRDRSYPTKYSELNIATWNVIGTREQKE